MKDEPQEAFNWTMKELIEKPPYSHYDMVIALAKGEFLIDGFQSSMEDAEFYANEHDKEPSAWQALQDIEQHNYPVYVY